MSTCSTIRGISGDVAFLQAVAAGTFQATVHSVFRTAMNLRCCTSGDLFTLATHDVDNAPNTIVVDADDFRSWGAEPGTAAVARRGCLRLAGRDISVAGAARWHMPAALDSSRQPDPQALASARDLLDRLGARGGVMPERGGSQAARVATRMLRQAADDLCAAWRAGDIQAALTHARGLIGLGPGLTPSGDDFLVGFLAALRLRPGRAAECDAFCRAVAEAARTATNDISRAAIEAAAQGRVRQRVARLVLCLCGGVQDDLQAAIAAVLELGSSSGTDIAWGIVRGLETALSNGECDHGAERRH